MKILPPLLSDSYKQFHVFMYPENLTDLFSGMTPRKSRMPGVDKAVLFGLQYYAKEYLIKQWNELFFEAMIYDVVAEYKRFHKHFSGVDVDTKHIEDLHRLGYLPIEIMALPEGSKVPIRVPFLVIHATDEPFGWLVNFIETAMSNCIWEPITVATIAYQYRILLDHWCEKTGGDPAFVLWQGHDFSMRGKGSIEASGASQAGHLLSFTGTDTIPAVLFLEEYYNANMETELIGGSVPATEHSVMMCGGKEDEIVTFIDLMKKFPTGILSIVSDTWDLWKVCTEYLPILKNEILARDGKIVIRPDSGDPVDIICGTGEIEMVNGVKTRDTERGKGVIELLWEVFGGTINEKGFKVLDPHIGAIYGDSITLDRAEQICERLAAKGFASTNIVFGIGSFTYQYNTRDTLGMAIKATYCEVLEDGVETGREIFKDPVTDDGEKKSAKGLLAVYEDPEKGFILKEQATWADVYNCAFKTVFKDSKLIVDHSLSEIRKRLNR